VAVQAEAIIMVFDLVDQAVQAAAANQVEAQVLEHKETLVELQVMEVEAVQAAVQQAVAAAVAPVK
jgi:hypothetical protein